MKRQRTLTGLHMDATQITCAICSVDDAGAVRVLGSASSKARGIERGAISNLSEVSSSIVQVVEKAQAAARTKVVSVIVNCDGLNIRSYNARGTITIADKENEITKRDIERVIEGAKAIALPFGREIIHSVIRGFVLDGQEGIKDPSGMYGTRLEVDIQIVTGLITNIQNISRAINIAGYEIEGIFLSGVTAGEATLEGLEKDLGVVLIYISYSTTDILIYNAGEIKYIDVLPMGSGNFIESVSVKCRIPHEYAGDIIRRAANLDRAIAAEGEEVTLRIGGLKRSISKRSIYDAIEPRAKEFISNIGERLRNIPFAKEIASGCVVVGELSDLGGFLEMMEASLNMPVRMGVAKGVSYDAVSLNSPGFISCVGLVRYYAQESLKGKFKRNIFTDSPIGKLLNRVQEIFSDYF